MSTYNPGAHTAISSVGVKIVIGMERPGTHGEEATGTIDGTNKKFTVKYPIFPKSKLSIAPQPGDVKAYLYKAAVGETPEVWTEATVTAINTTTDSATDMTYYGEVELSAAPASATTDNVYIDYYGELTPYKLQSASEDTSRDTTEVIEIGSDFKQTTIGAKSRTMELELIVSDLDVIQELGFEEYDGTSTVQSGYDAFDEQEGLTDVLLYVNMADDSGDFKGRYYYTGRLDVQKLFDVKAGDSPTATMQVYVDDRARMIKETP